MTSSEAASDPSDPPGAAAALVTPPGGWTERRIDVGDRSYSLLMPARPDALLEDPEVHSRNREDDYMPYWAFFWPAALPMARLIVQHRWPTGCTALEIGCGGGLVGLAALDAGLEVALSDYDQEAVDLALWNAARNGHPGTEGIRLDWRSPLERKFSVILGCEVIYEARSHAALLELVWRMLAPQGVAWFGDPGRRHAAPFVEAALASGFEVAILNADGLPHADARVGVFQLITLGRPASGERVALSHASA